MEHANIRWTLPQTVQPHPPPVNVQTPYQTGDDWGVLSWIRDAETQTMPGQNLVREVFINMVVDRLKAKGLPLIACPHTRGLQLDNVINGIVDSHSVMCTHPSLQQQSSLQQGIQLQDVDDDDVWEMEEASQIVKELTKTLSHSPGILNESENVKLDQRTAVKESAVQRKRPVSMIIGNLETPLKSPKRAKSSTGLVIHKCDKCDKNFTCAQRLNRHRVTHFQDRPFKCKECDFHAKTAHQVNRHFRRIHLKQYPHHCVTCGKGYPAKSKLSLHEKTHLNIADKDKPFVCNHCEKGFFLSRLLDEHLAVHEKDKRYKCDLCPHLSITRKNRWSHLNKTHQVRATRKTSMCLVCNKELHEFHVLVAHMKENHEIAGIPCEVCRAKFNSKSMLEHHLREEHEIAVCCEICRAKFKSKSMLQRHMRKEHMPNANCKEYMPNANCKECGLILESEKALKVHMKRNHWFVSICKQCGKGFLNMTMLETHKKRYHWTANKKTNETLKPSNMDKLKSKTNFKQKTKNITDGLKKTTSVASVALSLPKKSSTTTGGASGSTSDTATTTDTLGNSSDAVINSTHVIESSEQSDKLQSNFSVTNEHAYSAPSSAKNTSSNYNGKQEDPFEEQEKGIQQADRANLVTESTSSALFSDGSGDKAECESKGIQQAEMYMTESTPNSFPPNQKPEIAGKDQTETQPAEFDVMSGSISSDEMQGDSIEDQSKELHPAHTTGTDGTASNIFPSFVVNISEVK